MNLRVLLAAAFAVVLSVGPASASTISINDASRADFYMSCPFGCTGMLSDGSESATAADAFRLRRANEGNIARVLSDVLDADVTRSDVSKYDRGSGGLNGSGNRRGFSFDAFAGLFFVKYGPYTAFFRSDADQTVEFTKVGGGQGGLSNYGVVDVETSPVPIPAAGILMLAALFGLTLLRRRNAAL